MEVDRDVEGENDPGVGRRGVEVGTRTVVLVKRSSQFDRFKEEKGVNFTERGGTPEIRTTGSKSHPSLNPSVGRFVSEKKFS